MLGLKESDLECDDTEINFPMWLETVRTHLITQFLLVDEFVDF